MGRVLREPPVVPADAGGGGRRLARRQGLAAGPLLLASTLAALTAAALLTAALVASLATAPAVAALATPLDRITSVASSSSSWLSTTATAPLCLCPCKANRRSAFVASRRMSSWSSPSSWMRSQAGSLYRKKSRRPGTAPSSPPGAVRGQPRANRQQPLDPLVLGESMLLQEILLQNGVRFVVVWMGNCVETQLDDLLAEGGDGVVEPVSLVHHPLGSEAGLHVGEPPGGVVCPERWQHNRPLVCRHCRVKNEEKSCVSSKLGFTPIKTQWQSCLSLFDSSQNSTDYITIGGFPPCITIPRFTTPTHWRIY